MQFDPGEGQVTKTFHQHQVQLVPWQDGEQGFQARLARFRVIMQQRPTLVGSDQQVIGAGLAQFVAVLAGGVDLEVVMGMLDHADAQPGLTQPRQHPGQQGGLAGAAPGGEPQYRWQGRRVLHGDAANRASRRACSSGVFMFRNCSG